MDVSVQTMDDNKIKAEVTLDAKTVDAKIDAIYKDYAKRYNFPGFRRGRAPRPVIDNAVGREAILATATEELINEAYPLVVEQEKLYPVASPDFGEPSTAESGKPLSFEFTLAVKPVFELSSYDPVEIEVPKAEPTEKEVDSQIDALREHYKSYASADEGAVLENTNSAEINVVATKSDGEEIKSLSGDQPFFALGIGLYSESFDEHVKGMKVGEKRSFKIDVPKDEQAVYFADLTGEEVSFEVMVKAIQEEKLPELTDEWVKETLQMDSVEDLRKNVAESIERQVEQFLPQIKENACARVLVERFEDEVPESMVEQAESTLLQDFFTQLQSQGMSFDTYLKSRSITSDQFKEDVKKQAADQAAEELALEAWAHHAGIEVTDEDVSEEFAKAGLEDPKKTEEEWRRTGRLYMIREGILRAKAMENVIDTAKITEVEFDPDQAKE